MPCYHPMPAVRMCDGTVKFVSRNKSGVEATLELPCGQCIGCRLERSRQWAMRCMHEASLHDVSSFVTLTYADDKLPPGASLRYSDFQAFMKRLRDRLGKPVRFYMCGEYGSETNRPHYHAIFFGLDFSDKVVYSRSKLGNTIYSSKFLDSVWRQGDCRIGGVTFDSCAYVARYCVAKVNGDLAAKHYEVVTDEGEVIQRVPEFNHMSLKPGIGRPWLDKFMTDVYPRDYVVVNGVKTKPPSYYDDIYRAKDELSYLEIVAQREYDMACLKALDAKEFFDERMSVKEQVKIAQIGQCLRGD